MGPQLSAGGYVLPYISHVDMCRPNEYGFFSLFCLKTGIDFAHLVSNRVWFSRELLECMNVNNKSNQAWLRSVLKQN